MILIFKITEISDFSHLSCSNENALREVESNIALPYCSYSFLHVRKTWIFICRIVYLPSATLAEVHSWLIHKEIKLNIVIRVDGTYV